MNPQPPPQRGRGRARWAPFNYRRATSVGRRPKTISVPVTHSNSDDDEPTDPSASQPVIVRHISANNEQYPGWNLYFPEECKRKFCATCPSHLLISHLSSAFNKESNIVGKIKAFEAHITSNLAEYDLQMAKKRLWYSLSLTRVSRDANLMTAWPTLAQDLVDTPEETLKCLGLAMYQQLVGLPITLSSTQSDFSTNKDVRLQQVHARIQTNLKPVTMNSIKVDRNGKLIVVRGNVVRVSSLEYRATWIAYRCLQCNAEQAIKQPTQAETRPRSCPCKNRSSSSFVSIVSSPFTTTEACQTIHLQETLNSNQSGRVPRTIKIELFQDLVDSVYPGDDVTVTAIVQCPPQERPGAAPLRDIYLKAVSLLSNRNATLTWKSTFSDKDLGAIQAIKSQHCPFRLLVHSLSPSIYGHELIKAGLVLALLGGSDNQYRRSQCHILIVGDPGLGKSQMLQSCADASPKGECDRYDSATANFLIIAEF